MNVLNAKATIFLDTRRTKNNGNYPIKVRVYYNNEDRTYKTGLDATLVEWQKINSSNLRDEELRLVKRKANAFLEKASNTIDCLDEFSFDAFKDAYYDKAKKKLKATKLSDLFDDYIHTLETNEQIGTAIMYKTVRNSIVKFKGEIKIQEINQEFIAGYEKSLQLIKLSPSTIGIYLRHLRAIINKAIREGYLSPDKYPFKGYKIPSSRNIKKALSLEQIRDLLTYETEDLNVRKALDFWLFSYISNGMNMADICLLKPASIEKDFFHFYREKTKNTKKKDLRPIKVPLGERTRYIIQRWGDLDSKAEYVFPILKEGLTAKQIKYKIQDFIYFVNQNMKKVCNELGIEKTGTYAARHSHSTMLKRKGVPTAFIKENLGHSSVLMTENYLDDFIDDVKIEYNRFLTELE